MAPIKVPMWKQKADLRARKEKAYDKAIAMYLRARTAHSLSPSSPSISLRDVASRFPGLVTFTTLSRKVNRDQNLEENDIYQRTRLRFGEEMGVLDYVRSRGARGLPCTHRDVTEAGNAILRARCKRERTDFRPLGKRWSGRFVARHHAELKMYWTRTLEGKRAQGVNQNVFDGWTSLCEQATRGDFTSGEAILPENIANLDETGWQPGIRSKHRVIGPVGQKIQYEKSDGDRQNITIVACVMADGTATRPLVIMAGQNILGRWRVGDPEHNVANADIAMSGKAWINGAIAFDCIVKYEAQTRAKANGRWRLLYWDGHRTHCSFDILHFAMLHKILIICLPPHSSHVFQPLDLTVFGPFKQALRNEALRYEEETGLPCTKDAAFLVIGRAWKTAVTENNIKAGFKRAGLWPCDPTAIPSSVLQPSQTTSVLADAPIRMPGTLKKVVRVMREVQRPIPAPDFELAADGPSRFPDDSVISGDETNVNADLHDYDDTGYDGYEEDGVENNDPLPFRPLRQSQHPTPTPVTPPSHPQTLPPPQPESPSSSRARGIAKAMKSALVGTSQEHLINPTPATSSDPAPPTRIRVKPAVREPDFSVLAMIDADSLKELSRSELEDETKKLIIELDLARIHMAEIKETIFEYQGSLVLAGMQNAKQTGQLRAHEEKKQRNATNHQIKPDASKGLVMTSAEVLAYEQARQAREAEEEAKKVERANERVAQKLAKSEKALRTQAADLAKKLHRERVKTANDDALKAYKAAMADWEKRKAEGDATTANKPKKPKPILLGRGPRPDAEIEVALGMVRSLNEVEGASAEVRVEHGGSSPVEQPEENSVQGRQGSGDDADESRYASDEDGEWVGDGLSAVDESDDE